MKTVKRDRCESWQQKRKEKQFNGNERRKCVGWFLSYGWCLTSLTTDRHRALTTQFYSLRFGAVNAIRLCIKCILYPKRNLNIPIHRRRSEAHSFDELAAVVCLRVWLRFGVYVKCFSSRFVSHAVKHVPNANTFTLITWHVVSICVLCFVIATADSLTDWLNSLLFWIYATAKTCSSVSNQSAYLK